MPLNDVFSDAQDLSRKECFVAFTAQLHKLAAKEAFTDVILVLPTDFAAAYVRGATQESDVGGEGPAACIFHVNIACGTACLSAKAELPFRFNGGQDWFSSNIHNWRRYAQAQHDHFVL